MNTPYRVYIGQIENVQPLPEGNCEIKCSVGPSNRMWIEALSRRFGFVVKSEPGFVAGVIKYRVFRTATNTEDME